MNKFLYFLFLTTLSSSAIGQTLTIYNESDGMINDNVNCVTIDNNNEVWIGTQMGFSHFDGMNWENFDMNNVSELVDNNITAIEQDAEGNLWLGTDFGMNKYDGSTWTSYTTTDGLGSNQINCLKSDVDGNIWIGTNQGLTTFDGSLWTNYGSAEGIPFGGVKQIQFDENGTAHLCTGLSGVLEFDTTVLDEINEEDQLLNERTTGIAFDSEGNKFISHSEGITVFDDENLFMEHHTMMFELPEPDTLNPIQDVKIDDFGNIWAGVYIDYLVTEGGVSMYNGIEWVQFEVEDGLSGPLVRQLAIDDNNDVWVATSTGLTQISEVPVQINENNPQHFSSLYPNPCKNSISYDFTGISSNFRILSLEGKTLMDGNIFAGESIDVSQLSDGVYIIQGENQSARFVKN